MLRTAALFFAAASTVDALTVTVGVRLSSDAALWLEQTAIAVSNPTSSRYGEKVPKATLEAFLAPSQERIAAINKWIHTSTGLTAEWSSTREFLTVQTVSWVEAEALDRTAPTTHVDYLHVEDEDAPTARSPLAHRASSSAGGGTRPQVTPQVIWKYLDIDWPSYETLEARVGVASPFDEVLSTDNVKAFQSKYGVGGAKIDASTAQACSGGEFPASEPELDMDMCAGTAPNATCSYYCGPKGHSQNFCKALLDYLVWAGSDPDAPAVHTFSYGDQNCQDAVRAKMETQLQKLATQRITTLWAAGDACGTHGLTKALYPASSPWATSVGGVQLKDASANATLESWGCKGLLSFDGTGGGFDPRATPGNYSSSAVSAYLSKVKMKSGYKTTGRAFPDISAFASDVCVSDSCGSAGTSAATPISSGVIALLNAARAAANKTNVGFPNHLFYAHPEAFTDVTEGSGNGYPMAAGWDPSTGLGVPQVEKLKKIVLALP
jgi:hypothetical protein